jgi:hypothetical protein
MAESRYNSTFASGKRPAWAIEYQASKGKQKTEFGDASPFAKACPKCVGSTAAPLLVAHTVLPVGTFPDGATFWNDSACSRPSGFHFADARHFFAWIEGEEAEARMLLKPARMGVVRWQLRAR